MKKSNFDKHYEEYRHNKRFAGIFWMFAIIAIVVGATFALSVANTTTSHGILDWLVGSRENTDNNTNNSIKISPGTQEFPGNGSGGGGGQNGSNGSLMATYEGVLEMLGTCAVAMGDELNTTCHDVCEGIGQVCYAGFVVNTDLEHNDRPVPCGYRIWRENQRVYCSCCSVPEEGIANQDVNKKQQICEGLHMRYYLGSSCIDLCGRTCDSYCRINGGVECTGGFPGCMGYDCDCDCSWTGERHSNMY